MRRLRPAMSWLALDGLVRPAEGWVAAIRNAGFEAIQFEFPCDPPLIGDAVAAGLGVCGSARVNLPHEAAELAQKAIDAGLDSVTLHVGWGMESDAEAAVLIEAVLKAGERIPMYVETHRATIFQDMQRTVSFIERFPQLEFNGDFSHWYAGSEMVYGGFENKLRFIQPVLERVRFVHGRIANPGCMQVAVTADDESTYVAHFRQMWRASFAGFLAASSTQQEFITFAPELLAPEIYYARTFDGKEESDRWEQSKLLLAIARECFANAERV